MKADEALVEAWRDADPTERAELAKAAPNGSVSRVRFDVTTEGSVGAIFKADDDDFVIWGPASVEVVDKERDRVKAEALQKALPQLLKRARLSYEHTDQIVGDILDKFETDEPIEVSFNGQTYKRDEFPTDVLELEGMEPSLFVAGNVYSDTQKCQEVRKDIENGVIDSYSISGEAVMSEMAVKDGQTFTDITELDLSAVTLCQEGMNQMAKFDVLSKEDGASLTPQRAAALAKSRITSTMSNDTDDEIAKFVDALDKTLDERLPDGDLATKSDVEDIVDEKLKAQETSPTEGTPDRPDGASDSPTESDSDPYEGDSDEWGEDPSEDSDKVEQTNITEGTNKSEEAKAGPQPPAPQGAAPAPSPDPADVGGKSYTREELKSILPDDQFKAIEPLLDEGDEGGPDVVEPEPGPEEEVEPEPDAPDTERDFERTEKSAEDLDWGRLTEDQKQALAKSGVLSKSGGVSGVGVSAPQGSAAYEATDITADGDAVLKADRESVAHDPAMRHFYDEDGEVQL